jgi:hypothetical protein
MRVRNTTTTPPQPLVDMPLQHSSQTRALMPGLRRKSSIRRPPSKFYFMRYLISPSTLDQESASTHSLLLHSTLPWIKMLAFCSLLLVNVYLFQTHENALFHSGGIRNEHRLLRGNDAAVAAANATIAYTGTSLPRPVAVTRGAVAAAPEVDPTAARNRTNLMDLLNFDDDDGGGAEQWREELEDAPEFFNEIVMVEKK